MIQEEHNEYIKLENLRIAETIRKIKHRIAVFSGKGGVGKTTVSVNLAYALSLTGNRTGLMDADVTGPNIAKMSGMEELTRTDNNKINPWESNNVKIISFACMIPDGDPVIWRGPMRSKLINSFLADVEWGELDYLIADLPPGTGDEILTITQKMNPDMAIIITTPQEVSLIDSHRAINMAKKLNIKNIALIENMSGLKCPKCGNKIYIFGHGGGKIQALENNIEFFGSLPMELEARELADKGKPYVVERPDSELSVLLFEIAEKIKIIMDKKE
jgi:ATP-binding protein involved in chromosome partitioning